MLSKLNALTPDEVQVMEMDGWTVHDLAEVRPKDITGYGMSAQRALHVIVQARKLAPTLERVERRPVAEADEEQPAMSVRVRRIKESNR